LTFDIMPKSRKKSEATPFPPPPRAFRYGGVTKNYGGEWFKIVERHGGSLKTLFHGIDGSRTLPAGQWLTAAKKMVKDGTSKTSYLSGFHVLPTRRIAENYLRAFRKRLDRLAIVRCQVRGDVRRKTHSRSEVYLADQIKLGVKNNESR